MTIDEIQAYLNVGKTRSVCVSRELIDDYNGFVREVTIKHDNKVLIEFNAYGNDEGGLQITILYNSLHEAIASVESYLGKGVVFWENCSKSGCYPPEPQFAYDANASHEKLIFDLKNNKISLPHNGIRYYVSPGYWASFISQNSQFFGLHNAE